MFTYSDIPTLLQEVDLIKQDLVLQFILARACPNMSYHLLLDQNAAILPVILVTIGANINEGNVQVVNFFS